VRFDPKPRRSRSSRCPNSKTNPYALGIGTDGHDLVLSEWRDIMGRLDPATGKVTEFPMPYTDNGMRRLLPRQGRPHLVRHPAEQPGGIFLFLDQAAECRGEVQTPLVG